MKRRLSVIVTVLIIGVAVFTGLKTFRPTIHKLPEISINLIDGGKIDFKAYRTDALLVTFWATTCSTCIQELPHLIELYKEKNKRGLEIIAIAMAYDPPNRVIAFSKKNAIPYPVALDISGNAAKAFGNIKVTPTGFLVDKNGTVIQQITGVIDINKLRLQINKLLNSGNSTD